MNADYDAGNSCATAVCDAGHCNFTTLPNGTPCGAAMTCTAGVCS